MPDLTLIGVDFSSRPTRRKPIVVAHGRASDAKVCLSALERFDSLDAFGAWLARPGPWIGGFDFPFGLPRELVEHLGWPTAWRACMQHYTTLTRGEIRDTFAAFCAARPAGGKFAHRACDRPAGSSPSMKWVNGDARRVALEAYPGLLARELIGARSYKSDDAAKHTDERLLARIAIVDALQEGRSRLRLRLQLHADQRDALLDDASGDALDAVLCLVQAAWSTTQPGHGLPPRVDPLEGWIVSA